MFKKTADLVAVGSPYDDKDQTEADDTGKGAEEHCQDDTEVEGRPHLDLIS